MMQIHRVAGFPSLLHALGAKACSAACHGQQISSRSIARNSTGKVQEAQGIGQNVSLSIVFL